MTEDPITSDPALLWTWTRIIIALTVILAFAIGADISEIPLLGGT